MKIIVFLLIVVVLSSCGDYHRNQNPFSHINQDSIMKVNCNMEKKGECKQIQVPMFSPHEIIKGVLDDVFDSVFVVRLETDDKSLIGSINQLVILNDTIYCRDLNKTKNICLFNMSGKFLRRIGSNGNGPYEYVEPTDMWVTPDGIFVLDQWQHKLIKYRHDGQPLFDKQLPFISNQIYPLYDGQFLFRGIDAQNYHLNDLLNYQFWRCDSSFVVNSVGLYRKHREFVSIWNNAIFLRNMYKTYYYNEISDTLYSINSDGFFTPEYYFTFPRNHSKETLRDGEKFRKECEYISVNSFCILDEHYLVYTLFECNRLLYVFDNLKTKSSRIISTWEVNKSNLSRLLHFEDILTTYKNYVVSSFPSYGIIERYNLSIKEKDSWWSGVHNDVFERDKELAESVSEDDNDVLVFFRLRRDL